MIVIVLIRITLDNPYIGFSLYLFMTVGFMIYTNNNIECDAVKEQRNMLKTPVGRKKYYDIINSQ